MPHLDLDRVEAATGLVGKGGAPAKASGPIAPAGTQPAGALSGHIIYTSAGHDWAWTGSDLARNVVHGVAALEDASVLVTIALRR